MPLIERFTCARCGAERKDANHWWIAVPEICTVGSGKPTLIFRPWMNTVARLSHAIHLCGEACATKELSAFMSPKGGKS